MLTREPETGHRIAHFQILERLGSGGMGVVYKAQDMKLGRFVALKFMAPERETSEDARLRFLREARALSVLDHPNVCTLYEVGETEGGQLFLAMALCQGETLRSRLGQGPLEPGEAVRIAIQVAEGLSAAHARGIVHRDIKPGNILIGDGQVRIVDFGVARLADQTPLTREGLAVGTVQYTAPEQLFGGDVGPAADLWSLGVVLYELLASHPPFPGNSVPEVIVSILKGTPPRLQGVAPELWRILRKALTKAPQLRYQSAEEMRADLLAVSADTGSETQSLQPPAWLAATALSTIEANLLHNLPFPPLGNLLKGRSEDLQALDDALEADSAGIRSHVIHGLGGIGKTRLVVEHAWACGSRYRAVLFVLADSPEGLNSGLAALARNDLLNLPERDAPAESEVTGAVLRWLRQNPGWLLILDNVDTKEAQLAVTRLLPALASGQVLITSRRRDWPAGVERQSLDVIALAAATDFLIQRTAKDRRREPDDVAHALRLAELLDGLPLALEQAAAYISHIQMSIAEYLEVWESECDSVLRWYDEGVMQYPASLAITWQKTFRELTPTAKALLQLISWLAADPIPVAMLESGAETLCEAARRLEPEVELRAVREDIAELAALSLVGRQTGAITIHPIVQEVIWSRIPDEEHAFWIQASLRLIKQYAPQKADDANNWPIWDPLRPHAVQILAHVAAGNIPASPAIAEVMSILGIFFYAKGLYSDAEPLFRKALALNEQLFGSEDLELSISLSNLAVLLKESGRLEEAEPLMRRALLIAYARSGERNPLLEHPSLTAQINGLALLLMESGRKQEGEDLLRKALSIDRDAFGEDHNFVARDLHNLSVVLISMGRAPEAEPLIRQSLDLSRRVHGNTHPYTARRLQILAGSLREQGRTTEAEPMVREALELFEQILGSDHPWTRSARQDLETLSPVLPSPPDGQADPGPTGPAC